jgi:hypothetical protein
MKTGRNEPCPCGSGKKYKRCCSLNGESVPVTNINPPQDIEINDLNAPETLLHNFHNFMLRNKPHIKEYKRMRKLHTDICDSMVEYYGSGQFEHSFDNSHLSHDSYRNRKDADVFFLTESEFDLDTRLGIHAFYEPIIYKASPNANCITEVFINNRRYRKPEKVEMLQSMLDSIWGLFEVTDTDHKEGYAYIREVFTGDEYKLTDIGLSGNPHCSEFYIYNRIITYRGVNFGTGINLLFKKTDPFIQSFIERQKKDYTPLGEFMRFTELYNRFSKDDKRVKVVRNTL